MITYTKYGELYTFYENNQLIFKVKNWFGIDKLIKKLNAIQK